MTSELTIPYNVATREMPAMHFTQSKTGHVHSPWFTYDYSKEMKDGAVVYSFSGKIRMVLGSAKSAFAELLDIPEDECLVTVREDKFPGSFSTEIKWRISTMRPHRMPKTALPEPAPKPALQEDGGWIEV